MPEVGKINATGLGKALMKDFLLRHKNKKCKVKMNCLIDTGATISVINEEAWVKLGRPAIESSPTGKILLGDNRHVVPTGVVTTKITIGQKEYPIKLIVVGGWRYEAIIGLDFLEMIDATVNIRGRSINVGQHAECVCNAAYAVKRKARQYYKVIAREDIRIPPMSEARVYAEISGSPPDGELYVIDGYDVGHGVFQNVIEKRLILFVKAGKYSRCITKGEVLGKAYPAGEWEVQATEEEVKDMLQKMEVKELDLSTIKIGPMLNEKKFKNVLKRYKNALDGEDPSLQKLRKIRKDKPFWQDEESKGRIFTPEWAKPVYTPQYRHPPEHMQEAERMAGDWINRGLIRNSFSSWNAPILMVQKPGGGLRFCIDYRNLNKITESDSYPMPRIDEILDSLGGATIFSKIDLQWGFYNIEMREEDKKKTAFSLRSGHYEWNVLPMGLKNSPAIFQRVMTEVLRPYIGKFIHVFVDDILIYSDSPSAHARHVEIILKTLADNGFKVNVKKSEFGMEKLDYLGFTICGDKVLPKQQQVQAIREMPRPTNIKELRSFTGMCNVFRWMIEDYATVVAPLEDLKCKGKSVEGNWGEKQDKAFLAIKDKIIECTGNYRVDWNKPIHFGSDASDVGISAFVWQFDEQGHMRPMHYWSRSLDKTQKNYPTQERECLALIAGLKALYPYIGGRKFDVFMDHESLKYLNKSRYTRKKMMGWAMDLQGFDIGNIYHLPGEKNVVADCLSRLPRKSLNEILKEEEKEGKKDKSGDIFKEKNNKREPNTKTQVPEEISALDTEGARVAWMNRDDIENLKELQKEDPYCSKIFKYFRNELPGSDPEYKAIVTEAEKMAIVDDALYFITKVRNKGMLRRLVIPEQMRTNLLTRLHEQAGHQGVHRTYELLQQRFWWKNMFKDVCLHVGSCKCRYKKQQANVYKELRGQHIVVNERWHTLAIDWLKIGRRGRRGCEYALTIVDLCTRFSIAIPTTGKDGRHLVQALRMVFGFCGYPQRIVSDNESMFRSEEFVEWLLTKGIEKTWTAVYNPRANGIDERFNQTLMNMINSAEMIADWDEFIWELFYFYNIAINASTEESPFFLQFLRKGRLPVDIRYTDKIKDEEFVTIKDLKRDLARKEHDVMEKVLEAMQRTHGRMDARTKMPKFKPFKAGDRVILKEPHIETAQKNKPIGTGPYTVHRIMGKNTYKLKDNEGKKLKFLINGRRLALITPRRKNPWIRKEERKPQEYIELEDIFLPDFEDKIEDQIGTETKSEEKTPINTEKDTPMPEDENFLSGGDDGEAMKAQKETGSTKSTYAVQRKPGRGASLAREVQEIKEENEKNLKRLETRKVPRRKTETSQNIRNNWTKQRSTVNDPIPLRTRKRKGKR
jgi:transposase InsO family protein